MPSKQGFVRCNLNLLVALLLFAAAGSYHLPSIDLPGYGTNDFIEYWSAFQLALRGENFYDPQKMLELQLSVGWTGQTPQMMWNPPWLLTLMSPVLSFNFLTAARFWFLLNVALAVCMVFLLADVYRLQRYTCVLGALTMFFFPIRSSLALGQTGVLCGFAGVILLWFLKKGSKTGIAASLVILTIKPHLLYLVFVAVLWTIAKQRRTTLFFVAVGLMLLLIAGTTLAMPGSIQSWIASLSGTTGAVHITEWRSATITQFISMLLEEDGRTSLFPVVAIPGCLAVVLFFVLVKRQQPIDWPTFFPPIAALSLATAPYGWIFDAVALLTISADLLRKTVATRSTTARILLLGLITIFHSAPFIAYPYIEYHHQLFWYPILGLVCWLFGSHIFKPFWMFGRVSIQ